ncbi:MAG: ribonuclease HII, partial [Acholeplasmataceae bacterium]|nr:ribonuclease HII [Acholeplasmataceae bacterium]
FSRHMGYPTKRHIELIKKYGVSKIHRKTFKPIKNILEKRDE